MKMPKALMEAINETTDALEQAACGLFDPKSMSLMAEWHDANEGDFRVTLTSDGGYSSDWDIDVEQIVPLPLDDKNVPKPTKRASRKRAQGSTSDDPAPGPG
jgi:hypothetical protein